MDDFKFHAENNGLTPQWFKQIYDRLMDFTEVRIPSMNESNIHPEPDVSWHRRSDG